MGILYDARKLKALGFLTDLSAYAGKDDDFVDELWNEFLGDEGLYKEFVYYADNHTFLDELKVRGYSMSDLYVWQMDKYNIVRELGKNPTACNKETLVLNAFLEFSRMIKDPEEYVKRIESGKGNDRL
ncbi:MAG TPA: hypothetical protein DIS78_07355 [Lachnospiraceae bacterium]|nr:hypothetical protein [Lachnospiraceae bacterium]